MATTFTQLLRRPATGGTRRPPETRQASRALDAGNLPLQAADRRQGGGQIRAFAELAFIPKAENIVFIGETGVGKTGLMSALVLKAVQNGYRALFIKAQDLFDVMYSSLADRSTRRLLRR